MHVPGTHSPAMMNRPAPALGAALRLAALAALAACSPRASQEGAAQGSRPDTPAAASATAAKPSTADTAGGWRTLFDGTSTDAWRGYRAATLPAGWRAEGGELRRVGDGGDIVTRDEFGNFELELEWKVAPGSNSGVMYRVTEDGDSSTTYMSGPEMQVLDDARHVDGRKPLMSAGALYGLYPAKRGVVRPAGQWNQARIVARGNHVEHWLNGTKMVDAELWSDDWNRRLAKSKFTAWPQYAKSPRGRIALQDHGDPVAYRHIRIREIR